MTIDQFLKAGVALGAVMLVAGCSSGPRVASLPPSTTQIAAYTAPTPLADTGSFDAASNFGYGSIVDDGFALPAIPTKKIDPQYLRQEVSYPEGAQYAAGTVVVDTPKRFLYVVQGDGTAMRYGIGVGKSGFSWAGDANVRDKQHWPNGIRRQR